MKLAQWRQLESLYNKALEMDESRRVECLLGPCKAYSARPTKPA